jgi:hypothetical protein
MYLLAELLERAETTAVVASRGGLNRRTKQVTEPFSELKVVHHNRVGGDNREYGGWEKPTWNSLRAAAIA